MKGKHLLIAATFAAPSDDYSALGYNFHLADEFLHYLEETLTLIMGMISHPSIKGYGMGKTNAKELLEQRSSLMAEKVIHLVRTLSM